MNILLKIARGKGDLHQIKHGLLQNIQQLLKERRFSEVLSVVVDVDPVQLGLGSMGIEGLGIGHQALGIEALGRGRRDGDLLLS